MYVDHRHTIFSFLFFFLKINTYYIAHGARGRKRVWRVTRCAYNNIMCVRVHVHVAAIGRPGTVMRLFGPDRAGKSQIKHVRWLGSADRDRGPGRWRRKVTTSRGPRKRRGFWRETRRGPVVTPGRPTPVRCTGLGGDGPRVPLKPAGDDVTYVDGGGGGGRWRARLIYASRSASAPAVIRILG